MHSLEHTYRGQRTSLGLIFLLPLLGVKPESWAGEMAQDLRALAALRRVQFPVTTWGLTTMYIEVWCLLLAFRQTYRQNTTYIINKIHDCLIKASFI